MRKKIYTDEFLISELQRFVSENDRVPKFGDMLVKNGYPSTFAYINHFKTWNKALETADLSLNGVHETRTGLETCCVCGCNKIQGKQWHAKGLSKGKVMCSSCNANIKSDYMNGNLNKESSTGKGFISQRIIAKFLNLELKNDCNCTKGFNYGVDLYDNEKYKYIDSKSSKLHNYLSKNSFWSFKLNEKRIPDVYMMLGWDKNRKNILKGWSIDSKNDLVNGKNSITIKNNIKGLKKWSNYEINNILLNEVLHKMSQKRKDTNGTRCPIDNESF